MVTPEQVAKMASKAEYYVTPDGVWRLVRECEPHAGWFEVEDPKSYDNHRINFEDVSFQGAESFWELVKMKPE